MAMTVVQVPLDRALLTALDAYARANKASRSAVIREACRKHLADVTREAADRLYEEGYRRTPEGTDDSAWRIRMLAEISPDENW